MNPITQTHPPTEALSNVSMSLVAILEASRELKRTMAAPPDVELDEWQSAPALIGRIETLSKGALNNLSSYGNPLRSGGDAA